MNAWRKQRSPVRGDHTSSAVISVSLGKFVGHSHWSNTEDPSHFLRSIAGGGAEGGLQWCDSNDLSPIIVTRYLPPWVQGSTHVMTSASLLPGK